MPDLANSALQDIYASENGCFGCGPVNEKGLRLKSFVRGEELHADWVPQPHHQAFEGMLNGGVIGALLDCHCNWTAAWHLRNHHGLEIPPCTVTGEYTIKLQAVTPLAKPVQLRSWVTKAGARYAVIEGELTSEGEVTARCTGTFVSVKEGHPAYNKW